MLLLMLQLYFGGDLFLDFLNRQKRIPVFISHIRLVKSGKPTVLMRQYKFMVGHYFIHSYVLMCAAKCWVFTNNNFITSTLDVLPEKIRFIVWQTEQAPSTEHHHLQGYLQLHSKARLSTVKSLIAGAFGGSPSCQIARGTAEQNIAYCTKEETRLFGPWQMGAPVTAGQRTDLEAACALIKANKTLEEVAESLPATYVRYHRGLGSLRTILAGSLGKMRSTFRLVYLWGAPGCGKTSAARIRWPDAYWLTENKEAWMGTYDGQTTIVVDDFAGIMPLQHVLRLCQPQPYEAPVKGGHTWVGASTVVLISNQDPDSWYTNERNYPAWISRLQPERNGCVIHWMSTQKISPEDLMLPETVPTQPSSPRASNEFLTE